MKILFDARYTRFDTHDGISRYGSNLVAALAKLHPVTMLVYDRRQLKLLPKDVPHVMINNPNSVKELFVARRLNRMGADVVFSPMQLMGSWGRRYKLLLTLHDVIFYKYRTPPLWLSPPVRLGWWLFHLTYWPQRLLLNRADYVITVSATSKRQIQQMKLTKRPIGVVLDAPARLAGPEAPQPTKREIVFMGAFTPYKNAELLITALPLLAGYKLHLTSRISPERRAELERLIMDKSQVKFWNGISDQDYADLLDSATALVTASKFEGFGLPLVEGMSRGVPVVCSDIPIFHEVGGEAALYFKPDSPQQFAREIRLLEDEKKRKELIERGLVQAKKFNWNDSARELLRIMEEMTRTDSDK
jgi:glycosyltransferase involved in cell wall biosynthesis